MSETKTSHRSLLLRSNRVLGASLVEHNLVNIEHLEAANERLFEVLKAGITRQAGLLTILLDEMRSVDEMAIIKFVIQRENLGLIDLRDHSIHEECRALIEPELTWATWTIPFDREENFHFVATAYSLSSAARQFWEERLGGRVIWYATSVESITGTIDRLAEEAHLNR